MPTRELTAPAEIGADLLTVVARLNRMATQQSDLPLPYAQARLLAQIEQQGASRISELAAADHCSQPTMTTQVQRLEAGGYVERRSDPSDARAVLVSVTPAGTATLKRTRAVRAAVVVPHLERLAPEQLATLGDAVDILRDLLMDVQASTRAPHENPNPTTTRTSEPSEQE